MIYREDLLLNLRFIVQSMRWLVTGHEPLKQHVVQRFQQSYGNPAETLKWRSDSAFPGLLRHVEEVSLRLSFAIGQGLSRAPRRQLGRPVRCGFEKVYFSQSGLRWALGRADPCHAAGDQPIGLIRKGMAIQGGILSGSQINRFSIPLAIGESHPLTIVALGDGGWRQRQHDLLYKVGRAIQKLFTNHMP